MIYIKFETNRMTTNYPNILISHSQILIVVVEPSFSS